jgi:predicted permease
LCLLAIALLNLANLLATRAISRGREFEVRLALGATRTRLALEALADVVPMLALGGIGGVVAATMAVAAFVPIAPPALARFDGITVNGPVLVFSVVVLALTAAVTAILPATQTWDTRLVGGDGRSVGGTRRQARLRSALVVAQIALALPLVVAATSLARSFSLLMDVDPGFRPQNVLTLHMAIPRSKYTSDGAIAILYKRILDEITALPGVRSAAMVNRLPLTGNEQAMSIAFDEARTNSVDVQSRSVTPGYFATLGIPLRQGRWFTERDTATSPLVVVIDEALARTLWPGQNPIGKRHSLTVPGQQQPASAEVVGVVASIRHRSLDSSNDRQIYFSYQQFTDGRIALTVRSNGDPGNVTQTVIQAIRRIDPEQPVYDVSALTDVVERSTAGRWLFTAITVAFAVSALLLAGVGLYAVIAQSVAHRLREFGVRFALGATRSDVMRIVIRRGSVLVALGAALGFGGAVASNMAMRTALYGIQPLDPMSFVIATMVLFGVGIMASVLPANRAARTDPATVLRSE